ncbi:pilus assembly protein [Pseudoxanthomonas sp.]|uniref:pilus assembly protein n=1 Tax=Pseudoxanthomonas sp. TaxID=1871049 RepID=UPI003F809B3A
MKPSSRRVLPLPVSRLSAGLAGFLITLAVSPVSAGVDDFPIPQEPLTAGTAVPPNLLLLLDDSGSMSWEFIFNPALEVIHTSADRAGKFVAVKWNSEAGYPGKNATLALNTIAYDPLKNYRPWRNPDGSEMPEMDPTATPSDPSLLTKPISLYSEGRHWFYQANPGITNPRDLEQYTLYKLLAENRAQACTTAERNAAGLWKNPGESIWPEGTCRELTGFQWRAADGSVITRSVAEEWRNYANWYGYHRTRMKVAKAAVSGAFSSLDGGQVRVGYAVLNQHQARNLDIPVQRDNGLFRGANRADWFARVYAERGIGDTPLREALWRAGEYFEKNTGPEGPWGPEPPDRQIACRQNFVILATDGEWTNPYDRFFVSNIDGTNGSVQTSPKGDTYQYKPVPPYRDSYDKTLADVAMLYWRKDLRSDLPNIVPSTQENPAFWQHMVTFTIAIGMRGSLDPVADWPKLVAGTQQWPNPHHNNLNKVDDLFHASVNGHGGYVSAMDPEALNKGLEAILGTISERQASASSLAVDGATLEAGRRSFVASFLPGPWTGDLKAYAINANGESSELAWSAAEGIPAQDRRRLYTHGSSGRSGKWPATAFPTSDQKTVLTDDIAAWIRGDRSREGAGLRARRGLLGDIVHSSPAYVKTAGAEAVFVGANDGMLHVFDATNGKELLAYVPGLLDMDRLKELSRAKGFRHQYFVDGPLAVARMDGGNGVLAVGTLGRGGRGVYGLALDLGRPDQPPSSWEFSGDGGMGQALSRPQLVRLRTGVGTPDTVVVANGINSQDGKAVLYVLDAATGELRRKMVAGDETGNGLSAPTVLDLDGDGRADIAYAGDLRGNVWQFGLRNGSVRKVFTAADAKGNRQSITGGIGVAFHPATRKHWVFFGTGRYLTLADGADVSTQSWYGVEVGDGDSTITRRQLLERKITASATTDGKPVRAFEKARPNDMRGKHGWVVDLLTPGAKPEGERMIGETQQIIGGRTLLAASMAPTGGGCGGSGRGYLNAIDPFTGGATSAPFFDVNGDGKIDGKDSIDGTPAGSIDPGLGMITDPNVLLGKLVGGGGDGIDSQACASGASGTTACVAMNALGSTAGRYGRVSWTERIQGE